MQSYDIYRKHKIPVDAILSAFLFECEKDIGVLRERLRTVRFVLPEDANTAIDTGIVSESLPIEDSVRRLAVTVGSVKVAAELLRVDSERSERSVRLRNIRMRQRLQNLSMAYTNIASALRDR